ncbi:something about silencing protein 10 [Spiromyces aspiralis]|uniref:Something about silencing protein 10 n=1 Tax=Spiromyces aspiralis TaxID=68401 RepID=A0ACC1HZJ9_9FUNG|nr:something about silencing protein 10 [Spiromyces aspiralis]
MGRRKENKGKNGVRETSEHDKSGAKIKAINTWDDIEHDPIDRFHEGRDKVLLDYDEALQKEDSDSEEEVFGIQGGDSSDYTEEEEEDEVDSANNEDSESDGGFFEKDDEKEEIGKGASWGRDKSAYYDADVLLETDDEQAEKEEEIEARKLQKEHLGDMNEKDFADDLDEIMEGEGIDGQEGNAGRLVLSVDDADSKLDIDDVALDFAASVDLSREKWARFSKLSAKERRKILKAESPELLSLVSEAKILWDVVKTELEPKVAKCREMSILPSEFPACALLEAKYQLTMAFLSNVAFYLTLKATEPSLRGGERIQDHPVISVLVNIRQKLQAIGSLETKLPEAFAALERRLGGIEMGSEIGADSMGSESELSEVAEQAPPKKTAVAERNKREKREKHRVIPEANLYEENYHELQTAVKKASAKSTRKRPGKRKLEEAVGNGFDDEFGELSELDEVDHDDKLKARRSLRHYATRIMQSTNKKDRQGRLSGDQDVPYKDPDAGRFRLDTKSIERISEDAKKRGTKLGSDDGDSDDGGDDLPDLDKLDDDEAFYQKVKLASRANKKLKAKKFAQDREAEWKTVLEQNLLEEQALPDDEKRKINYQIMKNKGLIPKRSKEQRNPRVKRRRRYEKAQKKLGSQGRKPKVLTGNYGGEETGIKARLSRSVKLG